jgi:hypothetical protein
LNISDDDTTNIFNQLTGIDLFFTDDNGPSGSYSYPGSAAAIPPPAAPQPPAGGKYDGTYDFSFTFPKQGGGVNTQVINRFFIIRNGQISSADGTVTGSVLDNFGNVRFTGPCWDGGGSPATWMGIMDALAGKNGQGTYTCRNNIIGGSWRAYNGT